MEEYSRGRVHKSGPEPWNGNGSTVYSLIRPGEIFESVARSLFTINEHAIANVNLLIFELPTPNMFVKSVILQISFYA